MAPPKLLGPDGQPIDRKRLVQEEARPTLAGVRPLLSDDPSSGLTPGRLAALLRAAEEHDPIAYLELAERMEEKDLHYASVLGTRKRAVSQREITVDAASDSKEDVAAADLVRELVSDDAFENALFDMLDAVGKGYSATEIVWEMAATRWWPRALLWRDPRWFGFDPNDGRTLMLRDLDGAETREGHQPTPQLKALSPFKYIVHRHQAKSGLPIRGGLARGVTWAYLFKNFGLKDWVIFLDTYGMPIRVGKYGPGATEPEKEILLRAVSQIGHDAAAIVPQSMMIEFIEAKASGATDAFERLCDWVDRQVSKHVVGQTLTTEVKEGSRAAATVHDEVRGDLSRSDVKQLVPTLQRDLVKPLVDLNLGPRGAYPKLRLNEPEVFDIPVMASALATLVPMGLKVEVSQVRDRLGFADPAPDAEVLQPPRGSREAERIEEPGANSLGSDKATAATQVAPRDDLDRLADRADEEMAPAFEQLVETLRGVVDGAASLEEVRDALLRIYPQLDAGVLAEPLRQALVIADLVGQDDAT